jgi:hypothetical protein
MPLLRVYPFLDEIVASPGVVCRLFSAGRLASGHTWPLSQSVRLPSAAETTLDSWHRTQTDSRSRRPFSRTGLWSKWGLSEDIVWS